MSWLGLTLNCIPSSLYGALCPQSPFWARVPCWSKSLMMHYTHVTSMMWWAARGEIKVIQPQNLAPETSLTFVSLSVNPMPFSDIGQWYYISFHKMIVAKYLNVPFWLNSQNASLYHGCILHWLLPPLWFPQHSWQQGGCGCDHAWGAGLFCWPIMLTRVKPCPKLLSRLYWLFVKVRHTTVVVYYLFTVAPPVFWVSFQTFKNGWSVPFI